MPPHKNQLAEMENILSKMPMEVCCLIISPEFGVPWKQVSRAIRNARLPMNPSSVAHVMCTHAARSLEEEEIQVVLGRLRLHLCSIQSRTWHVINLMEPTTDEPITQKWLQTLPQRLSALMASVKRGGVCPVVETMMVEDLIYISIQFSTSKTPALYVAAPPGQPVALVSSTASGKLLKACTIGLGYNYYEDACLHGKDKESLFRIASSNCTAEVDNLTAVPAYNPQPIVKNNEIDYTHRTYDEQYIDQMIGPNPPLLTNLVIKTQKKFYDPSKLNMPINITMTVKSEDLAKSLKAWGLKGAIAPTSDLFHLFRKIKSNTINYDVQQGSDSD